MANGFLGILIFLLITISGFKIASKYSGRTHFFKAIQELNYSLISCVSFSKEDLTCVISKQYANESLSNLLKSVYHCKINGKNDYLFPEFLTEPEKNDLIFYFNNLGNLDTDSQLKLLEDYKQKFNEYIKECKLHEDKEGGLYKKLGVIVGIIAFIIVV
ncbi:MAG: hypothetical protein IKT32_03815 [Clostridia bacterium]|nr:hypothetical protein [Clostridia bacterium]